MNTKRKIKVTLCIGHHPKAQGSDTVDGSTTEYAFWARALPLLKEYLEADGHQAVIVNRSQAGGTTPSYAAVACNATGADLSIEFHFNSSDNPAATGTETFYWNTSYKGKQAALLVQRAMVSILQLDDRGCKPIFLPSQNAYEFFRKTRMPALLVEPSFAGCNPGDWEALHERLTALLAALARAIDTWAQEAA